MWVTEWIKRPNYNFKNSFALDFTYVYKVPTTPVLTRPIFYIKWALLNRSCQNCNWIKKKFFRNVFFPGIWNPHLTGVVDVLCAKMCRKTETEILEEGGHLRTHFNIVNTVFGADLYTYCTQEYLFLLRHSREN